MTLILPTFERQKVKTLHCRPKSIVQMFRLLLSLIKIDRFCNAAGILCFEGEVTKYKLSSLFIKKNLHFLYGHSRFRNMPGKTSDSIL